MTKLLDNVQYVDIFVQVWEIPNNIKHAAAKETVDKIFFILAKGDSTFLPFTLAPASATWEKVKGQSPPLSKWIASCETSVTTIVCNVITKEANAGQTTPQSVHVFPCAMQQLCTLIPWQIWDFPVFKAVLPALMSRSCQISEYSL